MKRLVAPLFKAAATMLEAPLRIAFETLGPTVPVASARIRAKKRVKRKIRRRETGRDMQKLVKLLTRKAYITAL
ncbi:hypothetical protein [Pontibacter saemangeumensis]|uniref:hypothetical protein n=1 Tax=Pontibacter saemangeumensis TaxID=1084525 RepID=UPI0031EA7F0C